MLNPEHIRHHYDSIKADLDRRGHPESELEDYVKSDREWRESLQELEALKQKRNQSIPKGKPSDEERQLLGQLSSEIKTLEHRVNELDTQQKESALKLPNRLNVSVPTGADESENEIIRTWGTPREFDFKPLSHDELGEKLGILDSASGAKLAGSRFMVLKGLGAKLERALASFMLDKHSNENGYSEINAPCLVNGSSLQGTGQLPKFEDDLYRIQEEDLYLSPTAEVQLTNLHAKDVLDANDLPIKYTALTNCFRKEAGSYGKDMKGLIRLHQFSKVELVQFVHPDHSEAALESLLSDAESILQALDLPYRVMRLCSGDIGFGSSHTYDIEVWFPSQNTYREISSCSNFLDFQSRRAMIRYKLNNEKPEYVHTLNGSGLAVGRTIAAILENFQTSDAQVSLPKSLEDYI